MNNTINDINQNGLEPPYFKNIEEKYGIDKIKNIEYVLKNTIYSDIENASNSLNFSYKPPFVTISSNHEDIYTEDLTDGTYKDYVKDDEDEKLRLSDAEKDIKSFLESNPSLEPPYFKKLKEIVDINDLKDMGRELGILFSESNLFKQPVQVIFSIGDREQPFTIYGDNKLLYYENHDGEYEFLNSSSLNESTEVKKIIDLINRINII